MYARPATSPELTLFRSSGKWNKLRAVLFHPTVVFSARINQTFSTYDGVLEFLYDGAVGDTDDVISDMTVFIGSSAGAWDIGICRCRGIDGSKVYVSQSSDIAFANDQHVTIVNDFGLWAKHLILDESGVPFMDGGVAYTDQHTNMDPVPIMGGNRVLKLEEGTASTTFDWSYSYMPDGSAIAEYNTSCPTASGGSGLDTDTATLEFDTGGWHLVYLELIGENGATFFGVRYVWIEDDDNPSFKASIGPNAQDVQSGGWQFSLTLYGDVDINDVHNHALVLLFSEDHYGTTQQEIGVVEGCENIVLTGWIGREQISINKTHSEVTFTAYTAQYWLSRIPSYPNGVEFTYETPTAWTQIQNLTVDKGLWHFLHWRTTATRVMDVFLTGDTKYTKQVSSLVGNIWNQIIEIADLQLKARAGVTALNQLFIQKHPQYTPEADRSSFTTVMTIEKQDRTGGLSFDRVTVAESAVISTSGVAIDSTGDGRPYFGLAPGHTFPHYGTVESLDNLLVADQADVNRMSGLIRSHRNNELPDILMRFVAFNRLIGCFPIQRCYTSVLPTENIRGVEYTGYLYPTAVTYVTDPDTGWVHTEVNFEAETFESIAVDGDFPGQGDVSVPPSSPPPRMPDFDPTIPGILIPTAGVTKVLLHDVGAGLVHTLNFDAVNPTWLQMNGGLSSTQYQNVNDIAITPSGGIYIVRRGSLPNAFIAYAPSAGSMFTIVEDATTIAAKYPGSYQGVVALGINPFNGQVAYVIGGNGMGNIWLGTGTSFAIGAAISNLRAFDAGSLSYGFGKWRLTGHQDSPWTGYMWVFAANGASITAAHDMADAYVSFHIPVGTTDELIHWGTFSGKLRRSTGNGNVITGEIGDPIVGEPAVDPTGLILMGDWDTGRKGFSTDGAYSWGALPVLPVSPGYSFAYAGPGSGNTPATSRWIAARATIRYSTDMGQTVWINKEGNINAIVYPAAYPTINIIKVLSF